VTVFLK